MSAPAGPSTAAAGPAAPAKEYTLRAPTEEEAERAVAFLGAFPLGAPKFHDEDINSTWRVRRTDPQKPQRAGPKEKKRYPRIPEQQHWFLEDRPGHVTHKGTKEGAANSIYYVLFKEGDEFVALPVDGTVKFKPHFEVENALTLEEAETLMANRHKAGSNITQKLKIKSNADGDGEAGGARAKGLRSGLESDEEEDDIGSGPSRVKRERGEDDDDAPDRAESPEKGEDFDFDEVFDNDDDAMVPEDEEEEEPEEQKPKAIKAEEEEEEELGRTGADMKKILKKHRAEGYDDSDDSDDSEDEDMDDVKPEVKTEVKQESDDDDDSDMEDLDEMATNMAARQAAEKQARSIRSATPPVRPRPAADDDEDVPLAKKLKAEPAPAAKKPLEPAAVKSEPGSKPPSGSGTSTKPAAKTGEAAKLEITKEAVIAVLKTSGKILSGELINKFKLTHKLKEKADQKKFYDIVKAVAKLEEDPPGSKRRFVVLRKQYQ